MSHSSLNQHAYNLVASDYARDHGQALTWQPEMDILINYLSAPKQLLDLGCGPGDETNYLAEHAPTAQVTGIDFAESMIAIAQRRTTRAAFRVADLVQFTPTGKVQGVWARASLHHLTDDELATLFEHMSTYRDTPFILGMVNKLGSDEEIEDKQKYGTHLRRYFNYFSPEKVDALTHDHGFAILRQYVKPEGGHQFLVSFLQSKEG